MSRERVIVFAKAPRPGVAKTRLAADLDGEAAAAIASVLIDQTVRALRGPWDVELRITPDDAGPEFKVWQRPGWTLTPQGGGDLGERLRRAVEEAFASGGERVVVIGSDCPALSETDITDAFAALTLDDVVVGPAEDGGYWLLGLRSAAPAPVLFGDMPWGTGAVFEATRRRAREAGLGVRVLRVLPDVDTLEDWRNWLRMGPP